jgi:hypothetical protein
MAGEPVNVFQPRETKIHVKKDLPFGKSPVLKPGHSREWPGVIFISRIKIPVQVV